MIWMMYFFRHFTMFPFFSHVFLNTWLIYFHIFIFCVWIHFFSLLHEITYFSCPTCSRAISRHKMMRGTFTWFPHRITYYLYNHIWNLCDFFIRVDRQWLLRLKQIHVIPLNLKHVLDRFFLFTGTSTLLELPLYSLQKPYAVRIPLYSSQK